MNRVLEYEIDELGASDSDVYFMWIKGYSKEPWFPGPKIGIYLTNVQLEIVKDHTGAYLDVNLFLFLYNVIDMSSFDSLIMSLERKEVTNGSA